MTRRLTITDRCRTHPIKIVRPGDFVVRDVGEIEAEEVWLDPSFSLYCFDPEHGAALFVEVDDPESADRAAFYYQTQAELAVGLVSMPLEVFHALGAQAPKRLSAEGLIFVHSVSRCGSTLVSKVLQAVPTIHSLSEPDDLTQLARFHAAGTPQDAIRPLFESSIRWRCKPRSGPPADRVAIKPRSEVMVLADLVGACFSEARHIFLYRNGLAWMQSLFRVWTDRDIYDDDLNRQMEQSWSNSLPMIDEYRRPEAPMNPVQIRLLAWITCMEGYLRVRQLGVPTAAVRFEDLTTHPRRVLEKVFEFCQVEGIDWATIDEVLARDSQAGTIYDREQRRDKNRQLTPELIEDVRSLIASRPLLGTPEVLLPGTIS